MRRDPCSLYDQLRRDSPLHHFESTDLWLVLDHAGAKRAITDHDAFGSAVAPGSSVEHWLIFSDPPRHARQRALILRAFTSKAVAALEPRIRELSRDLLDRLAGRGELEFVADYALPLPLLVIAEMLGAPADDYAALRRWSDVMLGLSLTLTGGEAAQRAQSAYAAVTDEMREYLERLLAGRRAAPRGDLLTALQAAEIAGERLSLAEILGFFQLLLVAGHETTTNLLSNAVLAFIAHPDQRELLLRRPELLAPAIEEVLRHRSPVQAAFRVTTREVALHGCTIPAGKQVLPMIGAANRDPAVFVAPERFDITRDPNPHLAFGHGGHSCIGAPLSRLEARVALPDLLLRLPGLRLADDEPWPPREALHVHGPERLRLLWDV